jgi:hypothetical protein
MSHDHEQMLKARRETLRWMLLRTLHISEPQGMNIEAIVPVVSSVYEDVTALEVERAAHYLASRDLLTIKQEPAGRKYCRLTRYGIDIVEYTVDCEPGIARPRL